MASQPSPGCFERIQLKLRDLFVAAEERCTLTRLLASAEANARHGQARLASPEPS
jgi:hypothetical protein